MPTMRTTTTFQIAHDSDEMLNDLVALTALLNDLLDGRGTARFESVKSDFGYVVVETEEET